MPKDNHSIYLSMHHSSWLPGFHAAKASSRMFALVSLIHALTILAPDPSASVLKPIPDILTTNINVFPTLIPDR